MEIVAAKALWLAMAVIQYLHCHPIVPLQICEDTSALSSVSSGFVSASSPTKSSFCSDLAKPRHWLEECTSVCVRSSKV